MNTVRESWTDERLNDFAVHVDRRFDRVDGSIREMRSEIDARFGAVDDRFDSIDSRLDSTDSRLDSIDSRLGATDSRLGSMDSRLGGMDDRLDRMEIRFDGLQRTLFQIGGGIIAALIALIATQL